MSASRPPVFERRDIDCYDLPLPAGITLLHPERTVLRFVQSLSLDFGARCYLRRRAGGAKRGASVPVDPASLDSGRQWHIRLAIETVSDEAHLGLKTLQTLFGDWADYLRFIDWCDATGRHDALDDEACVRRVLKVYIGHLRERTSSRSHPLSVNTAAKYQNVVIDTLTRLYGYDALSAGINLLYRDERLTNQTEVPDEAAVARVLSWCECLVSGVTDLLVNHKPYPFALPVPNYLGAPANRLWVFPTITWAVAPGKGGSNRFVDYANGRIRTPEEIHPRPAGHPSHVRRENKRLVENIEKANADPWHHSRIERGLLAMKAYLVLLIAASGQNLSVVANLPWSEELESQVIGKKATRPRFRTIKYRAGGAEITFEVGLQHVELLRRYLQLRKHLLHGLQCDQLFFNFGANLVRPEPAALNASSAVNKFYDTLRSLDSDLPKVMPREFRAAKADFLIRITDAATAAIIMQQSPETADRNYRAGSQTTHVMEMSELWKRIEAAVDGSDTRDDGLAIQQRAGGGCTSPEHPIPIIAEPPATPDCRHPEGCFFCDKYHAHADEQDAHKLLSARFCIHHRASLRAGTQEDYERHYRPVLEVIDLLVNRIRELKPGAVAAAERRVEDGDLTPYWAAKMLVLVELEGVL